MTRTTRTMLTFIAATLVATLWCAPAHAQMPGSSYGDQTFAGETPEGMEGVGVDEMLGDRLDLRLEFVDETGRAITLADCFNDDRPVILTPIYFNCPMLCTLILNGLLDGAVEMEWTIGEEYRIVSYSIHEDESHELAAQKKQGYLDLYNTGRRTRDLPESDGAGWTWLTGSAENIAALNDALGYRVKKLPNGEISHSSCIMIMRPDGTINQYMNDVVFQPRDLRLAMIEASDARLGSPLERFLLMTCFSYDAESNQYVASAWKIMRTGGALTVVLLGGGLFLLFRREQVRRRMDTLPMAAEPA